MIYCPQKKSNDDIKNNTNSNYNNFTTQISNETVRHSVRAMMMAFAAAGVVSWVQILVKIESVLLFDTFSGSNQLNQFGTYLLLIILLCLVCLQLYLISENMRIFDAVLIVPLYNSLLICLSVALSGMFFDDFKNFSWDQSILFGSGILCIACGITLVTIGQNKTSMEHHKINHINYVTTKNQNTETQIKLSVHAKVDSYTVTDDAALIAELREPSPQPTTKTLNTNDNANSVNNDLQTINEENMGDDNRDHDDDAVEINGNTDFNQK